MKYLKIGQAFSQIRNGATIKQDKVVDGIPITRIETIADGTVDLNRLGYASVKGDDFSDFYLEDGDILMSHINSVSHLGKVAIFENRNEKIIHGMNLLCLKTNPEILFPKYAFLFLKSLQFRSSIKKITKKSVNQASFNISNLKEIDIPVPPLPDQLHIANLLSKAENLIAQRKESIRLLDEFLKSTFLEMFGDPVSNEKGWEVCNLSELGSLDRGVSKARPRNSPELLGGIYPLIQTGDVTNAGIYITTYKQTYSELGLKQSKLWPKGTMLITIAANIAQTSILSFAACFPDSVVGFVTNTKKIRVLYVHFLFKFFQTLLESKASQTAQKNINLDILRNLKVPCPPIELQTQFAQIVDKTEALKTQYQQSLLELENLYGSLSQKAFRGELSVKDETV